MELVFDLRRGFLIGANKQLFSALKSSSISAAVNYSAILTLN